MTIRSRYLFHLEAEVARLRLREVELLNAILTQNNLPLVSDRAVSENVTPEPTSRGRLARIIGWRRGAA